MTPRPLAALAFAALASAALSACTHPSGPQPSAAARASCRAEVDRVYAAQNRADLTARDGRDTPFTGNYFPGDTPRGLSGEYSRDNQYSSCIANSASPAAPAAAGATPSSDVGPVFSPGRRP